MDDADLCQFSKEICLVVRTPLETQRFSTKGCTSKTGLPGTLSMIPQITAISVICGIIESKTHHGAFCRTLYGRPGSEKHRLMGLQALFKKKKKRGLFR